MGRDSEDALRYAMANQIEMRLDSSDDEDDESIPVSNFTFTSGMESIEATITVGGEDEDPTKLTVIYEGESETVEDTDISLESGFGMHTVRFDDADVIPDLVRGTSTNKIEGEGEVVVTCPDLAESDDSATDSGSYPKTRNEGTVSGVIRKADPFELKF